MNNSNNFNIRSSKKILNIRIKLLKTIRSLLYMSTKRGFNLTTCHMAHYYCRCCTDSASKAIYHDFVVVIQTGFPLFDFVVVSEENLNYFLVYVYLIIRYHYTVYYYNSLGPIA